MNSANAGVLAGAAVAASVVGGLWIRSATDVAAGFSAALLSGLTVLLLGGWLSARLARV